MRKTQYFVITEDKGDDRLCYDDCCRGRYQSVMMTLDEEDGRLYLDDCR